MVAIVSLCYSGSYSGGLHFSPIFSFCSHIPGQACNVDSISSSLRLGCVIRYQNLDLANLPKEIADYINKMGARIPNIKPGKATIEYITKIQASTRFWGRLLLSFLATSSTVLDHYLRSINQGFSIGFTSVLIIVGSIIELRRSYHAYNVMPSLSKALKRL